MRATDPLSRKTTIIEVPESLEIRPVDERNARLHGEQSLPPLLGRFLEPALLDQRLEALEDGVQPGPVGEDAVREGLGQRPDLLVFERLGHGQVEAAGEAAAFARLAGLFFVSFVGTGGHGWVWRWMECGVRVVVGGCFRGVTGSAR